MAPIHFILTQKYLGNRNSRPYNICDLVKINQIFFSLLFLVTKIEKLSTQTVPPQPIQPKKKTLACHARLCLIIISFLTVYLFLSSETLLNIFFEEHLNIVNHTLSHSNSTTELELFQVSQLPHTMHQQNWDQTGFDKIKS